MATNRSMIEALGRMYELIEDINKEMKELNAWNEILKRHINEQKKHEGQSWNDRYEYDEETGTCDRLYETNKL